MSDPYLIVVMDIYTSKKYHAFCLETYSGEKKIVGNGIFSGLLHPVDIFNFDINIVNDSLLKLMQTSLHTGELQQISKALVLCQDLQLLSLVATSGMLFYRLEKLGKVSLLTKITHHFADKFSPGHILEISNMQIYFHDHTLYWYENAKTTVEKQLLGCLPQSILLLEKDATNISQIEGHLYFRYGNEDIHPDSKKLMVSGCFRNLKVEKETTELFLHSPWHHRKANIYAVLLPELYEACVFAYSHGVQLFRDNRAVQIYQGKALEFSQKKRDWFELSDSVSIEGETYALTKLMDMLKHHQDWVQLDDAFFLFPHSIQQLLKFPRQENTVHIPVSGLKESIDFLSDSHISPVIVNTLPKRQLVDVHLDINDRLLNLLRPYQIVGVRWLKYLYMNGLGGCLADEMGLGKTIQTLATLSDNEVAKNSVPDLIVVPKTLLFNWLHEIASFFPEAHVILYYQSKRCLPKTVKSHTLIITTYGIIDNDIQLFASTTFNCLVFDEAQALKNSRTKHHQSCLKLKARFCLALTGTPIENSVADIWSIYHIVLPGYLGKRKEFITRYVSSEKQIYLHRILSPVLLRRTKEEVLKELPPKQFIPIYNSMDDKQRELYDAILITIRTALQKHGSSHVMTNNSVIVLNGLLRLRQICCHPQLLPFELNFNHAHSSGKFDQFCDLVARLISERRKIVVFCQFTSMLKIILRWVIAQHIPHWYLDGTTENRGSIVEGFECADIGIFLISLKAGGTGINLVSAHDVIVYDPWWNPAVENQAIDRLHRIGQTETVSVYKMITIDSIEEKIVKLQNEKKDIFDAVLQHQETPQSFEVLKKLLLQ